MPMSLHDIPGFHVAAVTLPSVASGASGFTTPAFVAPYAVTLREIDITFSEDVTWGSNRFSFQAWKQTSGGSASIGSLNEASGTITAFDPTEIYSSTTGVSLAEGEVVEIRYVKVNSGFNVPPAHVKFSYLGA